MALVANRITDATYRFNVLVLGTNIGTVNIYQLQDNQDLMKLDLSKPDFHHRHSKALSVKSVYIGDYSKKSLNVLTLWSPMAVVQLPFFP